MRYDWSGAAENLNQLWPFFGLTIVEAMTLFLLYFLFRYEIITEPIWIMSSALVVVLMWVETNHRFKLKKKLRKEIVIDEQGVTIIDTKTRKMYWVEKIYEINLNWNEIIAVELFNSQWKGSLIKIITEKGPISFWLGFQPDIGRKISKEINAKIMSSPGS